MRTGVKIRHEFVEFIPKEREEGVLYISIPCATAVHNCFCGCGLKVVTPISPVGWQLTFDGETVTLFPSIGSWSFPCRSHYFIHRDAVIWSKNMSQYEIELGRARDQKARDEHFGMQTVELADTHEEKTQFQGSPEGALATRSGLSGQSLGYEGIHDRGE